MRCEHQKERKMVIYNREAPEHTPRTADQKVLIRRKNNVFDWAGECYVSHLKIKILTAKSSNRL
jgi:hypothetical protein